MTPTRVLFVCLGNICRSPAAEIIFRHQVASAGLNDHFEIDSAGTIGFHHGAPPDPRMASALESQGYTVAGSARQLVEADLESFDLIVTMDEANQSDTLQLDESGRHHSKVRPFVSFCSAHDDTRVPDPYYGGQRGFDHVISLLKDGCSGILDELKKTRPQA